MSWATRRWCYDTSCVLRVGDWRIAQLGERGPYKAEVAGSIPAPPTIQLRGSLRLFHAVRLRGASPPKAAESPRITPGNGNGMARSRWRALPRQPATGICYGALERQVLVAAGFGPVRGGGWASQSRAGGPTEFAPQKIAGITRAESSWIADDRRVRACGERGFTRSAVNRGRFRDDLRRLLRRGEDRGHLRKGRAHRRPSRVTADQCAGAVPPRGREESTHHRTPDGKQCPPPIIPAAGVVPNRSDRRAACAPAKPMEQSPTPPPCGRPPPRRTRSRLRECRRPRP